MFLKRKFDNTMLKHYAETAVLPEYKIQDTTFPHNYRSVRCLPTMSKKRKKAMDFLNVPKEEEEDGIS